MTKDPYKKAYATHKSNAKQRGIEFKFTLDEWKKVWLDSGKWDERGRGADKYCMCRIADLGCYEVGNVFIGLGKTNVRDGNLGKPDSAETKHKKSMAAKGKLRPWCAGDKNPMHRPEVKAKMAILISGANHYKARGVITPSGFYATAKIASQALGMTQATVEWRARNNKFGFSLPAIS